MPIIPLISVISTITPLIATLYLSACGSGVAPNSIAYAESLMLTTEGGSRPTIAVDPRDGTVYVTWVGTDDGVSDVWLSRLDPGATLPTPPIRVNEIPGDAAPHDQAPARVSIAPDGRLYLVWQNNTTIPGRRFPASDLRFTYSTDRGESFAPTIDLHGPGRGGATSHTFHDMVVTDDGEVVVSWIESGVDEFGDDTGPEIRVANSTDQGRSFHPARLIDEGACPCCKTSLTARADGAPLIAWRKVFDGEMRDIVVASDGNGQTTLASGPRRVYPDQWRIEACPHAGPALSADNEGRVHIAWYTGAEGRAGIYLAQSEDGGSSFGEPIPILRDNALPPSQVALAPAMSGALWIALEDRPGHEKRVRLAILTDESIEWLPISLPGGSPALAYNAGVMALAWLDGESVHLRVAR